MAIQRGGPVHVGIGNQTTVTLCTAITEHQRTRGEATLINELGRGGGGGGDHRRNNITTPTTLAMQEAVAPHQTRGPLATHRGSSDCEGPQKL